MRSLRPFPGQLHEGAGAKADLLALQRGDFRDARATVIEGQQQRIIASPRPTSIVSGAASRACISVRVR